MARAANRATLRQRMMQIIFGCRWGYQRRIIIWVLLTLAVKLALVGGCGMASMECVDDLCGASVDGGGNIGLGLWWLMLIMSSSSMLNLSPILGPSARPYTGIIPARRVWPAMWARTGPQDPQNSLPLDPEKSTMHTHYILLRRWRTRMLAFTLK